ncbi:MAG: DNA-3-methyladenine glycosylase 2 family protein [Candidatus Rokubacteria bacterium]|nr:DNA-3-methyladenine glycosylase 2 family protein [Candidatus Rokubacteria bacterium]
MNIQLSPEIPLDVPQTLARYRIWGEDPCNRLHDGVFRRVLALDGELHGYALRWSGPPDDARITIAIPGSRSTRAAAAVRAEVGRLLFLDADVLGFYRVAKSDAGLQALIAPFYGMRPTLAPTPFEMLVGAITAQQVNLAFAVTIRSRLCRRFGRPVLVEGERVYAFPAPEALGKAKVGDLRRMQFSTRKAEYIIGLARLVARGELDFERLATLPNEQVIAELTRIRGFGRWTAEWFLARALGRGDVCPAGDLAVRKCFAHFYSRGRPLSERAIRRRAAAWGPHQNLAIHYLLAGLRRARAKAGGGA